MIGKAFKVPPCLWNVVGTFFIHKGEDCLDAGEAIVSGCTDEAEKETLMYAKAELDIAWGNLLVAIGESLLWK